MFLSFSFKMQSSVKNEFLSHVVSNNVQRIIFFLLYFFLILLLFIVRASLIPFWKWTGRANDKLKSSWQMLRNILTRSHARFSLSSSLFLFSQCLYCVNRDALVALTVGVRNKIFSFMSSSLLFLFAFVQQFVQNENSNVIKIREWNYHDVCWKPCYLLFIFSPFSYIFICNLRLR